MQISDTFERVGRIVDRLPLAPAAMARETRALKLHAAADLVSAHLWDASVYLREERYLDEPRELLRDICAVRAALQAGESRNLWARVFCC